MALQKLLNKMMLVRRRNRLSISTAATVPDLSHHFNREMRFSLSWIRKRPGWHQRSFLRKVLLQGLTSSKHHKGRCFGGIVAIFGQVYPHHLHMTPRLHQPWVQERPLNQLSPQRPFLLPRVRSWPLHTPLHGHQDSFAPGLDGRANLSTDWICRQTFFFFFFLLNLWGCIGTGKKGKVVVLSWLWNEKKRKEMKVTSQTLQCLCWI